MGEGPLAPLVVAEESCNKRASPLLLSAWGHTFWKIWGSGTTLY